MKKMMMVILMVVCSGCTRPEKTKELLEANGYSNVVTTGYAFWLKGEGDTFSTGFTAMSPNGKPVKGAVTGGILKGSTIRFN